MNQIPAERQTLVKLFLVAAVTVAFTGCTLVTPEPLETYAHPPFKKGDNPCMKVLENANDIPDANKCAQLAIIKYGAGQYDAAKWGFWTDTGLITLGVATGASALFGGSTDLTHGLGLATATGSGIRLYLAGPKAAKTYQSGSNAAACVLGEISTIDNAYNDDSGTRTKRKLVGLLSYLNNRSDDEKKTFSSALKLGEEAKTIHDHLAVDSVYELIEIDQMVRTQIANGRSSNFDQVISKIKASYSKKSAAAAKKQQTMAALRQNEAKLSKFMHAKNCDQDPRNSNCRKVTSLQNKAKDLTDLATNIITEDANLGKCAAKVGST